MRDATLDLVARIDELRLTLDIAIHNISPTEPVDTMQLRDTLFGEYIGVYFEEISSLKMQQKIVIGILNNPEWLADVASRTVDHQIGFIKIPIISLGGNDYKLSNSDKTIKLPSIELRLHIYGASNEKMSGEYLHSHGFDLYSKVSAKGVLVDQRFDLYENPTDKETQKRADQLGVDIPSYHSEAQNLEKSAMRLGADLPKASTAKVLQARETYRFAQNKKTSEYDLTLFSPMTKTFTAEAKPATVADGESVRLHLSEEPHFVISAQGTHTFCLTLRRPGERAGELFKPSFLLVDSNDPGLSQLDFTGTVTKKAAGTMNAEQLSPILENFLTNDLNLEVEYSETIKAMNYEERIKYKLSNLLNIFLKMENKDAASHPEESLRFMMTLKQESFITQNMNLKESLADPKIFKVIFQSSLRKHITSLFSECYKESFNQNNKEHIDILIDLLPLVPYESKTIESKATPNGHSCG